MSPPRFELATPAEHDLEEIFFEVKERHGLLVAERVYDNLLRTFELLAGMLELWPPQSLLADLPCLHRLSE